jgi:hypothetical protein
LRRPAVRLWFVKCAACGGSVEPALINNDLALLRWWRELDGDARDFAANPAGATADALETEGARPARGRNARRGVGDLALTW